MVVCGLCGVVRFSSRFCRDFVPVSLGCRCGFERVFAIRKADSLAADLSEESS